MFTLRFGLGVPQSVTTDDLFTAVNLADALAAKGWLGVHLTDADGQTVPWRTVNATPSHTVNRDAW